MLLYLLITCVPFFIFLKSQLPTPTKKSSLSSFSHLFKPKHKMSQKRKALSATDALSAETSLLDLPELALDCILERLPPEALHSMSRVCSSMRERCLSDRLWERHMSHKWGKVIGQAAYKEWQWHIASKTHHDHSVMVASSVKQKGLIRNILSIGWPFSWMIRSSRDYSGYTNSNSNTVVGLPVDSIMARYLALETGRFCFPAQVYNRENGHVGFMLSCYDAQISYDPKTDTFQARYPPHGRRAMTIETSVPWERLRAPPVETPPHDLHISDCLHELCPGDHIEIQWRRNKEFPYGWWYGMVGHLESCDGNENYCRCQDSDTVVLEFSQYTIGSRWRHTTVNRKDHREEGNEADGFYGGIRKLKSNDEISMWKKLWPTESLD